MKYDVIHLNTFDIRGGAARATFRLNEALNKQKYKSHILSLFKDSESENVSKVPENLFFNFITKILRRFTLFKYRLAELDPHKPFSVNNIGYKVATNKIVKRSKIIHLHWINYNFISISELQKLVTLSKPIIWTMHDMWALTGGCHNPIDCNKFTEECGKCPLLGSNKNNDISNKLLKKKKLIIDNRNITIIAPSNWMKQQVKKSTIFRNKKVVVIPNAIDINFFKKVSFEESKVYFPFIEMKKIYISFGSDNNAYYKGLDFLLEALKFLELEKEMDISNIELVIFGDQSQSSLNSLSTKFICHNIGKVNDDFKLRALYSMIDVFISPSLQESFGQVLTEAMACETIPIAFDYSGSKDIIDHKLNGYLAKYRSSKDIANGLQYLLKQKNLHIFQKNARKKVVENFNYDIVAQQHIALYNSLVQ